MAKDTTATDLKRKWKMKMMPETRETTSSSFCLFKSFGQMSRFSFAYLASLLGTWHSEFKWDKIC